MTYDPSIHHRRSIRLPDYDYSQAGAYFITICTFERQCVFGEVVDDKVVLNDPGYLVANEWLRISKRFPTIQTREFMVMPNHLHGVLLNNGGDMNLGVGASQEKDCWKEHQPLDSPLLKNPALGTIVGAYKSTTSRLINGLRRSPGGPVWQRNYYEHIIRDEESYVRIAEYILNNPLKWAEDDLYVG